MENTLAIEIEQLNAQMTNDLAMHDAYSDKIEQVIAHLGMSIKRSSKVAKGRALGAMEGSDEGKTPSSGDIDVQREESNDCGAAKNEDDLLQPLKDRISASLNAFHPPKTKLDEWLKHHGVSTGTNFVYRNDYMYNDGGQQIYHDCQRSGKKRVRKERTRGGVSGRPRNRKPSMKVGCPATLGAKTVTMLLPNGMPEDAYLITYRYIHEINQEFETMVKTLDRLYLWALQCRGRYIEDVLIEASRKIGEDS
ncbi:hypothetical protein BGX27_004401, partial [Mortierella sp. AM989]